ncbi:DMT family transporter [Campylobacter sp. faydin G-105]|uniref:DMT family transporter n=1 Tax=Campylobacter anatolicus TaxID=2829105 RepID=UPI001B919357|nr:DMT family transporter [Campylobacter anatolicus]MBR8461318.1 DMT family transporter [Campylobacter anatolicus]
MVAKKFREFGADFAIFIVAIVWGITFLPMSKALHTNGVFTILFWRFLIAFMLMTIISFKFIDSIDRNSIKYGSIVGVFLFSGFAFQTFALKYTLSSSVAFITGLVVVFVPFISFILFKARVSIYAIVGAILSAIGLYFLTSGELGFGLGEKLSLICAIAYALEIIYAARFVNRCEIFIFMCAEFATTAVFSLVFAYIFEGGIVPNLNYDFYFAIIVTSIFASVFCFFVQNLMQRYTTPVKTALILTFEPISAGVLGYFVGGERFSSLQLGGAGIIIIGILISEIGSYIIKRCQI